MPYTNAPYGWGYGTPATWGYQPWGYGGFYSPSMYGTYGYNPSLTWNYYTPGNYSGYTTPGYATGYTPTYGTTGSSGGSYGYGTASPQQPRDTALVNVRVPTRDAQVWIEGKKTQQQGTWREFVSPPLDPSKSYTYDVRARWTENGREVERTETVPVHANDVATVDFTSGDHSRIDTLDRTGKGTRGTTGGSKDR
jgi:uncharacterized protein (TIGR03000 family)